MEGLFQRFAQSGRDLGPDAEKSFERRRRLVHQHAQAVDGIMAPRLGVFQQRGFQRIVDDIADRGAGLQTRKIQRQRRDGLSCRRWWC